MRRFKRVSIYSSTMLCVCCIDLTKRAWFCDLAETRTLFSRFLYSLFYSRTGTSNIFEICFVLQFLVPPEVTFKLLWMMTWCRMNEMQSSSSGKSWRASFSFTNATWHTWISRLFIFFFLSFSLSLSSFLSSFFRFPFHLLIIGCKGIIRDV